MAQLGASRGPHACVSTYLSLFSISLQPGIFGETPGASFLMTEAALLLFFSPFFLGPALGSAAFLNHLDNVHSQWLMAKNLSPYLSLRIGKGLCIREEMGILVPTWSITLPGWYLGGWAERAEVLALPNPCGPSLVIPSWFSQRVAVGGMLLTQLAWCPHLEKMAFDAEFCRAFWAEFFKSQR